MHASRLRNIRAILLECTELPPYADALRYHTGLPVWDAVTATWQREHNLAAIPVELNDAESVNAEAADFYVTGFKDNPRFGQNEWQKERKGVKCPVECQEWDGEQEHYELGVNLTKAQKVGDWDFECSWAQDELLLLQNKKEKQKDGP